MRRSYACLRRRLLFTSTSFPFLVAFLIPDPPPWRVPRTDRPVPCWPAQRHSRRSLPSPIHTAYPQGCACPSQTPGYLACEISWRRWISSLDSSTLPSGIGSFSTCGIGLSLRQPSWSSVGCILRALSTILLFGDRTKAMTALVYHSRSAFFFFQLRHRTSSIKRGMLGFAGPTS